jgi:hypothetical protein
MVSVLDQVPRSLFGLLTEAVSVTVVEAIVGVMVAVVTSVGVLMTYKVG